MTNDDVTITYDEGDPATFSYAHKRCIGSKGIWTNEQCDCSALDGTTLIENECLCTGNPNQKYYNPMLTGCNTMTDGVKLVLYDLPAYVKDDSMSKYDRANSCRITGGIYEGKLWDPDFPNTCNCNKTPNMHLDPTGYFCECNEGYDYKDPSSKYEGCVLISEIPDYKPAQTDKVSTQVNEMADTVEAHSDTQGKTLEKLCQDQTWRNANCKKGDSNIYYCPIDNSEHPEPQLTMFHKNGCDGFDGDKKCIPKKVNNGYNRFCFNKSEGKIIEVEGIACNKENEAEAAAAWRDNDKSKYEYGEDDNGNCINIITQEETQQEEKKEQLAEKLKSAKDALDKAKEKENSWANRGLTAASTAAAGLGAMQLAEGIAEQRADVAAETDMRAYLATMKCNYGNGQNITAGNEEIFLPGGNELLELYTEYKTLADNLKITKAALGLRPGIESEVLYDRAESGLYKNVSVGKTGGAYTSLSRAMTDSESEDAAAWAAQKETSTKKVTAGAITAGVGVVGGAVGNYLINGRDKDNTGTDATSGTPANTNNKIATTQKKTDSKTQPKPTTQPTGNKSNNKSDTTEQKSTQNAGQTGINIAKGVLQNADINPKEFNTLNNQINNTIASFQQ